MSGIQNLEILRNKYREKGEKTKKKGKGRKDQFFPLKPLQNVFLEVSIGEKVLGKIEI
jgi:hypothetical protein